MRKDEADIWDHIPPILDYGHNVPGIGGGPSVIGGYIYRGSANPCLAGVYIYGDYQGPAFVAHHDSSSGSYSSKFAQFVCANDSPKCGAGGKGVYQLILSFSEDELGDVYVIGGKVRIHFYNTLFI